VKRVADQLGYGVESVRSWVRQAEVDGGLRAGTTSADAERIKELEQECRELRRANDTLNATASSFGAELEGSLTHPTLSTTINIDDCR
jgi:transposase